MSRAQLFIADVLLIGAGLAWAFIAGAELIIVSRDGLPPAPIGVGLMMLPIVGIASEFALIGLAAVGRFRLTVFLSVMSLFGALVLVDLEFSGRFIGYK